MGFWRRIVITIAVTLAVVLAVLAVVGVLALIIGQGDNFDIDRMLGIVGASGVLASVLRLMFRYIRRWLDTDSRDE